MTFVLILFSCWAPANPIQLDAPPKRNKELVCTHEGNNVFVGECESYSLYCDSNESCIFKCYNFQEIQVVIRDSLKCYGRELL